MKPGQLLLYDAIVCIITGLLGTTLYFVYLESAPAGPPRSSIVLVGGVAFILAGFALLFLRQRKLRIARET